MHADQRGCGRLHLAAKPRVHSSRNLSVVLYIGCKSAARDRKDMSDSSNVVLLVCLPAWLLDVGWILIKAWDNFCALLRTQPPRYLTVGGWNIVSCRWHAPSWD